MSNTKFDPNAKLWHAVVWTLRVSVSLQCLGFAREAWLMGTPLFSFLWNAPAVGGLGWPEATVIVIHQVAIWCLMFAAVSTLIRPCWPVLVPVAIWQLSQALANTWMGGEPFYQISLLSQSTRIVAPIGLLLLDPWPRPAVLTASRVAAAMRLLRVTIAVTFLAHGYESLALHPSFVDYVIVGSKRLFGWSITQGAAETVLLVIGAVDVAVALMMIVTRWRLVAYYMAFWGLITAVSRVLYGGMPGLEWTCHQALTRACHAGVPLAIGLYWTMLSRDAKPTSRSSPSTPEDSNVTPIDDT